jgi:hypothetical protein
VSADFVITGVALTVMTTVSFAVQPFAVVPVTMYCVVTTGVATGLGIFGLFKPVAGDQE